MTAPAFHIEPCCHEPEHGVFYVMRSLGNQIEDVCFSREEAEAKLAELRG